MITQVNIKIAQEITPIYTVFYVISAFVFGIFAFGSRFTCHARDTQPFESSFSFTVDISERYRLVSTIGFFLLATMIVVYHF